MLGHSLASCHTTGRPTKGGMILRQEARDKGARCGRLQIGDKVLETPCLLLSTACGSPAYISHDMLDQIYWSGGQSVPTSHLVSAPDAVRSISGQEQTEGMSVQMPTRLPVLIATNRDVNLYEFEHYTTNNPSVAADAIKCQSFVGGARQISTREYLDAVVSLRADAVIPIAYQAPIGYQQPKRIKWTYERTMKLLGSFLQQAEGRGAGSIPVFGPVLGGVNVELRAKMGREVANMDKVAGVALGGLHLGEAPEARAKAIATALSVVPDTMPRLLQGPASVAQVVAAVASGIDLLDSPLPTAASCSHVALTFPLPSQLLDSFPAATWTPGDGTRLRGSCDNERAVGDVAGGVGPGVHNKVRGSRGGFPAAEEAAHASDAVVQGDVRSGSIAAEQMPQKRAAGELAVEQSHKAQRVQQGSDLIAIVDGLVGGGACHVTAGFGAATQPVNPSLDAEGDGGTGRGQPPGGADGEAAQNGAAAAANGDDKLQGASGTVLQLDLGDSALAEDAGPLVPGCTCYTCRHHTRAYLHHLDNTREMVLGTLLDLHNTHHMHLLLAELRDAIRLGRFQEAAELYIGAEGPEADPTTGALVGRKNMVGVKAAGHGGAEGAGRQL